MIDPRTPVLDLLNRFGPPAHAPEGVGEGHAPTREAVSLPAARAYCSGLATSHYENFSVLTSLVPPSLREPFAAVYAFCRWSDDLGDETGQGPEARARSEALLAWWRGELDRAMGGEASHPVYVALVPVIREFRLPRKPFADLIDAFVQDQRVTRYQTWDEVVDYCTRSANPVGRLVLMLAGYREDDPRHARLFAQSDAICTALQLINFWQDVRRDLLERDRVYLPAQDTGWSPEDLRAALDRADDPPTRIRYIRALRPLVERTADLFREGAPLIPALDPSIRPVVWLFLQGGLKTLRAVERAGCATLWTRPRLSKPAKVALVARAWLAKSTIWRARPASATLAPSSLEPAA